MRKVLTFGFFIIFALITFFGCGHPSHQSTPNRNQPIMNTDRPASGAESQDTDGNKMSSEISNTSRPVRGDNSDFAQQAAVGGMTEAELGRLAVERAQNAEVKQFAQKMIDDHSKSNAELKTLAGQKQITLPTELDAEHRMMVDKLKGLAGAEFDRAYMDAMVADHEKTVNLFRKEAEGGTDPDLKAFAAKSLPLLETHLEMSRNIRAKLK